MGKVHPVLRCVRIVVGILKLPLFLLMLSLSFLYYCIALLMPFAIRSVVVKALSKVFFRILLLLLGHWYVSKEVACVEETTFGAGLEKFVEPGDVIIANFGSYLNLFWLQKEYAPLFAVPEQGKLVTHSFYSLFLGIITGENVHSGKVVSLDEAIDIARSNGIPLVIFPERYYSEGTSVLPFSNFFDGSEQKDISFHIMGFIHRGDGVSANYTNGSGVIHLFWMLGRSFASMKVRVAVTHLIPSLTKMSKGEWVEKTRMILGATLQIPLSTKCHSE